MKPFDVQWRTRVVFGEGAFARLGGVACEIGCARSLVVADAGLVATGQVDRGAAFLAEAGITAFEFHDFGANPDSHMVEAGRAFAASSPNATRPPSRTTPGIMFIAGEPMNPATNVFTGRS